jgi:hypothetical protein
LIFDWGSGIRIKRRSRSGSAFEEGLGEGREEVGVDEDGAEDVGLAFLEVVEEAGEDGGIAVIAGVEGGGGDAAGGEEGGDFAGGRDGDDIGIEAEVLQAGGEVGEEEGAAAAMEVGDEEGEACHGVNGNW